MLKICKNKKGVTILEGLIALGLLALVATGTFAVLLSTSRKAQTPDIREEMSLAIENAAHRLQAYVVADPSYIAAQGLPEKLCPDNDLLDSVFTISPPLHNIQCLLPPICDKNNSTFNYTVHKNAFAANAFNSIPSGDRVAVLSNDYEIHFQIICNGFSYDK